MARARRWTLAAGSGPLLIAVAVAAAVIALAFRYVVTAPPHRLVLAVDELDTYFTRYAHVYAERMAAQGVTLEIRRTRGAVENLAHLKAPGGGVDVAFVNGGLTDTERSPQLQSLGSVAYTPLWVVYRADLGALDSLPMLRGRRIGVGRKGSGTEAIARRVLAACGVDASNSALLTHDGDPPALAKDVLAGQLDAAAMMGPPEDPKIRALFAQTGLAVMSLSDTQGLARNLSFLHPLVVPKGAIDLAIEKPDRDLPIVASTMTLVARADVHPALVYLLMSIVDDVHEPPSLLHRENEFPADKDTDLALSPVAETYYRSGKPFLQRYLPFGIASAVERTIKVVLPVALLVFPFLRLLPTFYQWRIKRRLARVYRQLLDLEEAASASGEDVEAKLRAIEERLRTDPVPIMYSNEVYALREHIDLVRRQLAAATSTRRGTSGAPGSISG
jgi:TRAP-type uncharacterized transport system substrate-binding protein